MQEEILLDIGYTDVQKKVFLEGKAKFRTVAKGRRLGFTRACANYCIECLLDKKFRVKNILWVDTIQKNLGNYFDRYFVPVIKQIPEGWFEWKKQEKKLTCLKTGNILHMESAERPENLEGLSYELIILNEAGIILKNADLWEKSIRPMLLDKPHSKAIIGGVPKGKNKFFDLCNKGLKGEKDWEHFQFTTFDNPLLDKSGIKQLIDELGGESSDVVKQEIYGEFVDGTSNMLLSIDELERAMARVDTDDSGERVWALDVARYGDDFSVLSKRRGYFVWNIHKFPQQSTEELANKVYKDYLSSEERPNAIFIDTTGVGAGVFDKLEARNLPVREAIMSASPIDKKFVNKRAEMYYELSKKMKLLRIEPNEALERQSQMIEYFYNDKGKIQILGKEAIKKLYGKSPDELDSLAMLFYEPVIATNDEFNELLNNDWSGNGW
ncbi:hypothetical protein CFT13S00388_07945 [Campylobacter fetus subsp. testudinum]|uniref:terminase family protein n=1 Tax=Campylobacter fetus TaxID=196 RepID=UPI0008189044|nr:terminase family protein [Campylobacter fetus]OCR86693.1 hypothetical protein CFT13S00388_07945 [Campylobacter fetus subsp. testudinum]